MRIKVSEKKVKENYMNIICIGYCDAWYLLQGKDANYFTSGVYGWNSDIYEIDYKTCIVTGYRPFGNIAGNKNDIRKFNEKAREIYASDLDYEKRLKKIDKLLEKFVKKCLENRG